MSSQSDVSNSAFTALNTPLRGRPRRRTMTATATGVICAGVILVTSACGAGNVTQTGDQVAAVNGAAGEIDVTPDHIIKLNDVAFQPATASTPATMQFAITNTSGDPKDNDRLVSITPVDGHGTISIQGNTAVPASGSLYGAAPRGTIFPSTSIAGIPTQNQRVKVIVSDSLAATLRPGLTTKVKFTFAKAGSKILDVPVEEGSDPNHNESHQPLPGGQETEGGAHGASSH